MINENLKYVPVFRGRQEELKVLKSFDFGNHIYPMIEIVKEEYKSKEIDKKNTQTDLFGTKKNDSYANYYLPIIRSIKAEKIFVDLPNHMSNRPNLKKATLLFLNNIITKRPQRTKYLTQLSSLSSKIIPVISSFSSITGKLEIKKQEKDLRPYFEIIAFRTFLETFSQEIREIEIIINPSDYLIVDFKENELDLNDVDIKELLEKLKTIKANVVIHRNPIPIDITMNGLEHDKWIDSIDNSLIYDYKKFGGHSFSDYCGIKKDNISEGGIVSPGFIYYDGTNNHFYGFRFKDGGHGKYEQKPTLSEFETTIVPAVIQSHPTQRMLKDDLCFLSENNGGWSIINNISLGTLNGGESGLQASKFKRISMLHYLHCIKLKITNGDLK